MLVTIHQPQYLPWLGYFDKADKADIFILLDDVQYNSRDWQNRNRIRIPSGWQWITVPIIRNFGQKIIDTKIQNIENWRKTQLRTMKNNYMKSNYLANYIGFFEQVYNQDWEFLSELNIHIFTKIIEWLGIKTKIVRSSQYKSSDDSTQRLVDLCQHFNADTYLSGADGEKYMDFKKFDENNIKINIQNYQHPIYSQLWNDGKKENFISHMSIIDLLFNHGPDSLNILRGNEVTL